MAQIKTIVRKWGDSIAVIIPKKLAEAKKLKPEDEILISIEKETSLKDLFGKWKTEKTAQELKDESREGWE
ncbi:MAG: hypothetical protein AABX23_04065 [Nanoarchaeota archaeon]